ncbi:MAG TPA: ATP-binding protein [Polyangiaceae bacterium]|nr:ATP-binding protein [Polyangiaceae bacterium]
MASPGIEEGVARAPADAQPSPLGQPTAERPPRHEARTTTLRHSLVIRVSLAACGLVALAVALTLAFGPWLASTLGLSPALAGALVLGLLLPLSAYVMHRQLAPVLAMFRALAGTVTSYRDGDFSFSLAWKRRDELGELVDAHNALGDTLREQRVGLVQRELLLDTMVQNTPVAMLLFDPSGRVVYANLAARKLLNDGRRMEGLAQGTLLSRAPEPLRAAIERGGDGLFTVERDGEEDIYYLARRGFRLNGRAHELYVLRHLTAELRRQEVRTWKKVIRVISHELNNSLGPIASLAQSGTDLVRMNEYGQLERAFDAIAERARHLETFIQGYAHFAKLPAPRPESIAWPDFIETLRRQVAFDLDGPLPEAPAWFDPPQLEQALLNLLRNAHECGGRPEHIQLRVRRLPEAISIDISDRGPGMSEAVLSQALLPFYSTKRGGTGLGLAIVREIAEAHGGRVSLANREGGGLSVSVALPQ